MRLWEARDALKQAWDAWARRQYASGDRYFAWLSLINEVHEAPARTGEAYKAILNSLTYGEHDAALDQRIRESHEERIDKWLFAKEKN